MRRYLLIAVGAAMLAACNNEPEVTPAEAPNLTDPADTGVEAMTNDAPPVAQAPGASATAASWDMDNDTMIDRNEFTGAGDQGFLGWDTDNDDMISRSEFEQGWNSAGFTNASGAFTSLDANNDQMLGQNEFPTTEVFNKWDANSNGVLEQNEFPYYRT